MSELDKYSPFLGSLIVAVLAYFVQKRRQSGSPRTSEASDLWQASESIREYQDKQVRDLQGDLDTLRQRFTVVEAEAFDCLQRERNRGGRLKAKRGDVQ